MEINSYYHVSTFSRPYLIINFIRDISVSIATGYGFDDREVGVPSPGKTKNFHFSMSSKLTLGPTQPPIQCVPGAISPGGKAAGA
jgi:hypothetical protein